MSSFSPAYLSAYATGELRAKADAAKRGLSDCRLCPRQCRVDRSKAETGTCQTGSKAKVASYNAHFGEEACLTGLNGSGTIFFSHCNLLCCFCQNYDISHAGWGQEVTDLQLAEIMLQLQQMGCHNINLVTPSHVVPQILAALILAAEKGLNLPLVFNSSGYDRVETLRLLEGVVDVYMPDFKFWDPKTAELTCGAADYPEIARKAILEMHRQVGDLFINDKGLAQRGVLVRHLVMPEKMAGTREIMAFIAENVSPGTYVNIMSQYRPCGRAARIEGLNRPVSVREFRQAVDDAKEMGITRLDGRHPIIR